MLCHFRCALFTLADITPTDRYVMKACASAVYAVASAVDFKRSIAEVVMEGGMANVNGAVAGALLGCKLGYSALPQDWVQRLTHHQFLEAKVEKLCACLVL